MKSKMWIKSWILGMYREDIICIWSRKYLVLSIKSLVFARYVLVVLWLWSDLFHPSISSPSFRFDAEELDFVFSPSLFTDFSNSLCLFLFPLSLTQPLSAIWRIQDVILRQEYIMRGREERKQTSKGCPKGRKSKCKKPKKYSQIFRQVYQRSLASSDIPSQTNANFWKRFVANFCDIIIKKVLKI